MCLIMNAVELVLLWFSVKEYDKTFYLKIRVLKIYSRFVFLIPYRRTFLKTCVIYSPQTSVFIKCPSTLLVKLLLPEMATRRQHFLRPTPLL